MQNTEWTLFPIEQHIFLFLFFIWDGNQPTVFNLNIQSVYRKEVTSLFFNVRAQASKRSSLSYCNGSIWISSIISVTVPISLLCIQNIPNGFLCSVWNQLKGLSYRANRMRLYMRCWRANEGVLWAKNCVTIATILCFCINIVFFFSACL
jgi:hypothetical protein